MKRRGLGATSTRRTLAGAGLVLLVGLGDAVAAHDGVHREASIVQNNDAQFVKVDVLDLELTDQHGQTVNFRADVVGERIAVINFVYTSCGTVCPVTSAIFARVQERLGARNDNDVRIVSLTVDPVTDGPDRLRVYAQKYGADSGWTWLTGDKLSMNRVLEGLGAYTPSYEDHPSTVLVGDGGAGRWTRFFGFPSPDQIVDRVDALIDARAHSMSAATQQ